ncbi:MAG: LuxR C-terminal-related transcriptional regulator [Acidobacteriia bacterium]|nr:LuxR C-terminal-related transcriptional regulator [Terriglobia bacterium]
MRFRSRRKIANTNKESASHLHLSEQTVKNHVHRISRQVHAHSRSEIVETVRNCDFSL